MPPAASAEPAAAPAIVVDAYASGILLAEAFARHRPCLHVQSRAAMPASMRPPAADLFAASYRLADGGLDALVAALARHRPMAVAAATEYGVELADLLAARLGLPGNAPETSAARRDKFRMAEHAAAAGLPVAGQLASADLAEALAWYRGRQRPHIVVKPLDSVSSENVFICRDETEIAAAMRAILGTTNFMLRENRAVLLQDYLEGEEYVVNTISRDGRHWVSDIWHVRKIRRADGRKIYDHDDLLAPDAPVAATLVDYVTRVLDAIGLAVGSGHTELILTAAGPRLLETAARLSGAANPTAIAMATGSDQVELTRLCYLDPARLAAHPARYRQRLQARCVHLIARGPGPLSHDAVEARLRQLASFNSIRFRIRDGAALRPTIDAATCPGAFFLVHADAARIEEDYRAFRAWEESRL